MIEQKDTFCAGIGERNAPTSVIDDLPESLKRQKGRIERLWRRGGLTVLKTAVRLMIMHEAVTKGRQAAAELAANPLPVNPKTRSSWLLKDPDHWLTELEQAWLGPTRRPPSYRKITESEWKMIASLLKPYRHYTWREMAGKIREEAQQPSSPLSRLDKVTASTLCRGSDAMSRALGESFKRQSFTKRGRKVGMREKKRRTKGVAG